MSSAKRAGFLLLGTLLLCCSIAAGENPELAALLSVKSSFLNVSTYFLSWRPTSASPCSWRGVKCRNERVTHLQLAGRRLSGFLAPDIGNLTALLYLNLSSNMLAGALPEQISRLENLQVLDLHRNKFSGHIPSPISKLSKLRVLDLSDNCLGGIVPRGGIFTSLSAERLRGNPDLCVRDRCPGPKVQAVSTGMLAIMLSAIAVLGFLVVAGGVNWWRRRTPFLELNLQKRMGIDEARKLSLVIYSLQQLREATDDFDDRNIIGHGARGIVYKGASNGFSFAVKHLRYAELKVGFEKDLELFAGVRHKNIVNVLGYCTEQLVVSEYLPSGDLASILHGQHRRDFDWEKRKAVMLGVAKALSYLHSLDPQVVHGALKPSNVLIQDDYTPKISDHFLHSIVQDNPRAFCIRDSKAAAYDPPETGTRQVTVKSDCYAFGVLLLQMVTGKPSWHLLEMCRTAGLKLKDWASRASEDADDFVDENLKKPSIWEMKKIVQLAGMCMETLPVLRPRMDEVVQFLVEEVLVTNKSMELDDFFIDLVMDGHSEDADAETARRTESLLPTGGSSS